MGCYLGKDGAYEQGDRSGADEEVDERPSCLHVRAAGRWILDSAMYNADIIAQIKELEDRENLPRLVRDLAKKSAAEDAAKVGLSLDQVYAIAVAQGDAAPEAAKGWKKFKDFDDAILDLKRKLK